MSTPLVFARAALGACVAAALAACAPTQPTRADAAPRAAAPVPTAAPAAAAVAAAPPAAWPATSRNLGAEELRQRVSGKAFDVQLGGGTSARMDYRSNGYVFIDVYPSGANDSGRWRVDGSRVCTDMKRFPSDCNEWRALGDKLMLRRTNGQLITLEAR